MTQTGKPNITITLSRPDAEALLTLLESSGVCLYPDVVEDLHAALAPDSAGGRAVGHDVRPVGEARKGEGKS